MQNSTILEDVSHLDVAD